MPSDDVQAPVASLRDCGRGACAGLRDCVCSSDYCGWLVSRPCSAAARDALVGSAARLPPHVVPGSLASTRELGSPVGSTPPVARSAMSYADFAQRDGFRVVGHADRSALMPALALPAMSARRSHPTVGRARSSARRSAWVHDALRIHGPVATPAARSAQVPADPLSCMLARSHIESLPCATYLGFAFGPFPLFASHAPSRPCSARRHGAPRRGPPTAASSCVRPWTHDGPSRWRLSCQRWAVVSRETWKPVTRESLRNNSPHARTGLAGPLSPVSDGPQMVNTCNLSGHAPREGQRGGSRLGSERA